MKTTYSIIIVLTAMLLLAGCTKINFKPQTTEVSEIVDITDPLIAKPKPDDSVALFNLNNNIWEGGVFRLMYITNVSYNPMFETKIDAENEWLGNKFQRAIKVKKFYSDINQIISGATMQETCKDNSAVYFPIASELNRLSQSTADKKFLLVYSDLMENTSTMSFYDSKNLELIKTNPDKIKQYFDSQMKLSNLSGITVYLIYQPKNTMDDEQYRIVSNFYENLLESKGAVVQITASIN